MAALRRIGKAAFRNGIQHDTAYEAMLLFEAGYELEDQAASESRSRGGSPRRYNTLHPARARRGGDDRPGRPRRRGGERTRRRAQSSFNLQLLGSCRTSEAEPGVTGRDAIEQAIRERVQSARTCCRSVTPTATCLAATTWWRSCAYAPVRRRGRCTARGRSERLAAIRLAHAAGLGVDAIPGARWRRRAPVRAPTNR